MTRTELLLVSAVHDNYGNPLAGAAVYPGMTLPSGSHATGNANTGTDGTVTFVSELGNGSTCISTVTDLVKTGYLYDSGMNVEISDTLQVP